MQSYISTPQPICADSFIPLFLFQELIPFLYFYNSILYYKVLEICPRDIFFKLLKKLYWLLNIPIRDYLKPIGIVCKHQLL